MLNQEQQRLKASLTAVIEKWANQQAEKSDWENSFGEGFGYLTIELMSEAAFAVLMAVRDVQIYLNDNT